jgi:hypothetical protein
MHSWHARQEPDNPLLGNRVHIVDSNQGQLTQVDHNDSAWWQSLQNEGGGRAAGGFTRQ